MTLADVQAPFSPLVSDSWVMASWEQFVAIADAPENAKAKCYYFDARMRVEAMGVGPDHAIENTLITLALGLFCMVRGIKARCLTNASYRKVNCREAQPDASYYFGTVVDALPLGNKILNLDEIAAPNLAIEIAATSLNDDLGPKRLLYEALGIQEYWVVDVEAGQILAFQILPRGSQQIRQSLVLPGLEISVLETALRDRQTKDDSQIMQDLMLQFQVE
jgi:Uma2 family endonuclease